MSFHFSILALLYLVAIIWVWLRVIMRRPPTGVALAWMVLVVVLPLVGAVLYVLIGERRVGQRRARRIAAIRNDYAKLSSRVIGEGLTRVAWEKHRPEARGMDRLATCMIGIPTVAGSTAQFFSDSEEILRAIAADVDAAQKSVLMEFYIWNEGGAADEVFDALVRAAGRGVCCRLLVDAVGARPWWRRRPAPRDCGTRASRCCPLCGSQCLPPLCRGTISACTARSS